MFLAPAGSAVFATVARFMVKRLSRHAGHRSEFQLPLLGRRSHFSAESMSDVRASTEENA